MTPAGRNELIRQCMHCAEDLLVATSRADVEPDEGIEEPLLEAIAALERALALAQTDAKPDLRALSSDPIWIERKYDSQRK